MIEAIPTIYNNRLFKSKLECRWACLFDLLGVKWAYEPETISIGDINYIPDFWLPDYETYAEIKPVIEADRIEKPIALATKKQTVVLVGKPFHIINSWFGHPDRPSNVRKAMFELCQRCGQLMIRFASCEEIVSPVSNCKHRFFHNPNIFYWNYAFSRSLSTIPEDIPCGRLNLDLASIG